eukprot:842851_1
MEEAKAEGYVYPTKLAMPENTVKYKLTTDDFKQAIPSYDEEVLRVKALQQKHTPSVLDSKSWIISIHESSLQDSHLTTILDMIKPLTPPLRALCLILLPEHNKCRVVHHKEEKNSLLLWGGQGWLPYSTKGGMQSVRDAVDLLSDVWIDTRELWVTLFESCAEDATKSISARKAAKELHGYVTKAYKAFRSYGDALDQAVRCIKKWTRGVKSHELNNKTWISPCQNCTVYHLEQPHDYYKNCNTKYRVSSKPPSCGLAFEVALVAALKRWKATHPRQGLPDQIVQNQARDLDLIPAKPCAFSRGWLARFKKRHAQLF